MESSKSGEPQNLPMFTKKSSITNTAMTKKGVYVAISYMACAVLLVIFNKAALSSYKFPCANVITLFQMLSSSLILYALRRWRIISFTVQDSHPVVTRTTDLVPLKAILRCTPVALSYLLYMLVSMESIRGISVPMYTTLRRTTVFFTMVAEYFLAGKKYSSYVVTWRFLRVGLYYLIFESLRHTTKCPFSVGIIILGAFLAGARDLSYDFYSYTIVFISNITTALYLACISRIGESSGLNSFGLMWCNGIICTPILLIWTAYRGDLEATRNFPYLYTHGFQAVIFLSCALAFLLNYSVFLNTTINSALTQTVCGNLKDLFTVGFGWLVFRGLPFDLLNIVGQCLSFLGSCLYAYCKLKGI
ncbi:putative potassium channel SKOR-like [Capsicum annuum]|uniref:UDP-N-acetylglucosamine transporter UGNT1 isoform X1 n=1 Tax=Capsicum annuum TaxID=4072 RepID=UPI0007BF0730|nr:UDP-N-acetylglucosamine transporter UGNT1 isoform X1 [Capsicum annuum]KAF3670047.1 putative potassium channel SKOR-like [Capsicum annuum]